MFVLSQFQPDDAAPLAEFLNRLRRESWSLTSLGHVPEPGSPPLVTPTQLLADSLRPGRIGPFLLKLDQRIVSTVHLDDRDGDGKVAVVSQVETDPAFQRRGTFWRHLGEPLLRRFCGRGPERLEATTWTFNRKGIPLYKRAGFRAVPGTSLAMENYLPTLVRHPALVDYFEQHDFLRALECRRSYGYDGVRVCGLNLFAYAWSEAGEELRVLVDWERKQLVSIQRDGWAAWCFVRDDAPLAIFYCLENRTRGDLTYRAQVRASSAGHGPLLHRLPARQTAAGQFRVSDRRGRPLSRVIVDLEVQGRRVPFYLSRLRQVAPAAAPVPSPPDRPVEVPPVLQAAP